MVNLKQDIGLTYIYEIKEFFSFWNVNDNFTGIGYEFNGKEYYVGEFKNGEKNGIGTFILDDNILYEGE